MLRETSAQYTASFNRVCAVGWEMPRLNGVQVHHDTYGTERAACALASPLVCSARVRATAAIASCRTRLRKGKKGSCPQSKRAAIRYDARSAKVHLTDGYATLATVSGRRRVSLAIPPCHASRVDLPMRSSDLGVDRKGRLWLHVVVRAPEPTVTRAGEVVGIDLGVACPAVTSKARFFGKRHWREVEARPFRLRRALEANRPSRGDFHCKQCGLSLHADLNAARNIGANHLASLAIRGTGGPRSGGLSQHHPVAASPRL